MLLVMDDFVCGKLRQWGLSEWIETFEDEGIDRESLYCLEDGDIDKLINKVGPRARFKKRLKQLKEEQNPVQDTVDISNQTTSTPDIGKRKLDVQGESSKLETPSKRLRKTESRSLSEAMILSDVRQIMGHVNLKLQNQENTELNAFLKSKICDLEVDKREMVGVFGKTGAGKSSLINAVIGKKNLLPSGSVNACTSVMIKVEGNMHNTMYEAEIEFITKAEWKDELWSMNQFHDNEDQEQEDDEHNEISEKLSALYGDEWKTISPENLIDSKYFREIPEFLQGRKKILTSESAKELSARFVKYIRSDTKQGEGEDVRRWYWPLVKCVTVKVPNNDLLQHVTLVDLPGNGDRNNSRDQMWKGIVGNCSTVWIVTEINRAASEQESWEILKNVGLLLGNGGECQRIHFICTKSDLTGDLDDHSADAIRTAISERNTDVKREVHKEFNKLRTLKKHFSEDCLKVFTVSSREFFKGKLLNQEDTEIPSLQEFLSKLNDCHSETLNYVSGARGILSLIQGASHGEKARSKAEVHEYIVKSFVIQYDMVRKEMEKSYISFEQCLQEGVKNSKSSCDKVLKSFLYPRKGGSAFQRVLKTVVSNGGVHKPKKRKLLDLNRKLASFLTDSIDEEFRNTFPNDDKRGPFNDAINKFSLETETLIHKYKNVELQLIFVKTEEEKLKSRLNKVIRERKKTVYSSLTENIKGSMQQCYNRAAEFRGKGSLENMRETIVRHMHESKNSMFDQAKDEMMNQLKCLMEGILQTLHTTMKESIYLSHKTEERSIPDVSEELAMVRKLYDELKSGSDTESS
ncbi:nuclear GTPase SLIP-GC-like [Cololabis saira]|uniref:nuclear GTPase SLIP-GC-like n=1 Tax=Cololabis saira TaxID=129043 RepID=UPI002AD54BCA|nr:nuclear GTPase SLIP-GC-like [Cololabis saira]XP_061567292.1 nuclear GTPase SLIP-GC-like [Cololabis saira]